MSKREQRRRRAGRGHLAGDDEDDDTPVDATEHDHARGLAIVNCPVCSSSGQTVVHDVASFLLILGTWSHSGVVQWDLAERQASLVINGTSTPARRIRQMHDGVVADFGRCFDVSIAVTEAKVRY